MIPKTNYPLSVHKLSTDSIYSSTHQQRVEVLYQSLHNSQQSHHNGEVWFLHGHGARSRGQTLPELEAWRKELYHEWAHPLFEEEPKLLVLQTQPGIRYDGVCVLGNSGVA